MKETDFNEAQEPKEEIIDVTGEQFLFGFYFLFPSFSLFNEYN